MGGVAALAVLELRDACLQTCRVLGLKEHEATTTQGQPLQGRFKPALTD